MKTTKDGKFLPTVPAITWWLSDKIEEGTFMKTRIVMPLEDQLHFLQENLAHILDILNISVEARQKRAARKYEQQTLSAVPSDMRQEN